MKNARRRPARGSGGPRHDRPSPKKTPQKPAQRAAKQHPAPDTAVREEPRVFRLGVIPGATPGKWIDAWKERMPHVELQLVSLTFANQRDRLAEVDAAIVRLPLVRADDLNVIRLYDEVPVVVAAADSFLMATDRLTADDLARQVLITPADDVLGPLDLPTVAPSFAQVATTEEAVATVASGVGILVVPMSLARLHHRKDADFRPLLAGRTSTVALAWPREATTPDVETFVGIVRGRTMNSSR